VQGRDEEERQALLEDAKALEEAGVFSIVLECIPAALAAEITASVRVPTIGIGAGPDCDGQVLVIHDMLGLSGDFKPRFVKRYADLGQLAREAISRYCQEVREGTFPTAEHAYS
ncbi:MAG: 3-methyl-2-oxobutanoate hydroxymethyltransferase, partial [Clostridia bacterium]